MLPRLTDWTDLTDGTDNKTRKKYPFEKRMTQHISTGWTALHLALLCWDSRRCPSGPSSQSGPSISKNHVSGYSHGFPFE